MKVAYCFYGQPRRIDEGFAIVEKFMKKNPDIHIDFFYHTWFSKDISTNVYDASPWRGLDTNDLLIQPDSINKLNTLYAPKAYQVDEPKKFNSTIESIKESILYKITPDKYIQNLNNTLSQLYSIQQACNVLQTYIQNSGIQYDYIILSRFDFRKEIEIQLHMLTNTMLYLSNIQESIKHFGAYYISNYEIFLNITNTFDNLINLINNTELITVFSQLTGISANLNVEQIISMNYLFFYKNYENINFTPLIPNFI